MIVTPGGALGGSVSLVNANARYVVVSFPIGTAPAADQRLNVYRNGLKVGEVQVSGPQRENIAVADITQGEAQVGDEVRPN